MNDVRCSAEQDASLWLRRFWLFWSGITICRLLFLAISPLELAADEAYYWDWGRRPDWGYYSKPPLIAWINTASTRLLGVSEFTVRLPAVLLGAVGLIAIFFLARRLYDSRTAFWTVLLAALSPAACALNFIMTIDAPLMACWGVALLAFWRALTETPASVFGWWLALALAIGFGLLGKQMMLVFPLLMLLFLLLSPSDRYWLRTPWPWAVTAAGLLFLLPPLAWNAQHGWITFQHSSQHFTGNASVWNFLKTVPDFVGGQVLLISPLTVLCFVVLSFALVRKRVWQGDRRVLFLILFSVLPLTGFFLASFRQRINGNWPAVFYPAGLILTAAWLTGKLTIDIPLERWRKSLCRWVPASGALLTVITYVVSFFLAQPNGWAGNSNPITLLTGWQQLAREADAIRRRLPNSEKVFFVADHRQTVSELAFYLPGQPEVFLWNEQRAKPSSQYDLWPGPQNRLGGNAIIIFDDKRPVSDALRSAFPRLTPVDPLVVPLGEHASRRFAVYIGGNLQSWP